MKNFTIIFSLMLSFASFGAQNGEVAILSNSGEKFYVILNGSFQNYHPQQVVNVKSLTNNWYNFKVLSSNNRFSFDRNIPVKRNTLSTYSIVERNGFFNLKLLSESPLYNSNMSCDCNSSSCSHYSHGQPMMDGHPVRPFQTSVHDNSCGPQRPTRPQGFGGYNNMFMTSNGMANLKNAIRQESFSDDKLDVAKSAVRSKRLNTHQIKEIMAMFPFSEERLGFAKAAYRNCTNKSEYYLLKNSLVFSSDKKELQRFINAQY